MLDQPSGEKALEKDAITRRGSRSEKVTSSPGSAAAEQKRGATEELPLHMLRTSTSAIIPRPESSLGASQREGGAASWVELSRDALPWLIYI